MRNGCNEKKHELPNWDNALRQQQKDDAYIDDAAHYIFEYFHSANEHTQNVNNRLTTLQQQ